MDITTMGTVLAIVVITYLIGLAAKAVSAIKDELIPVIVGIAGGALGVLGMYIMPEFPANDLLNAVAIGIVSGLAENVLQGPGQGAFIFNDQYVHVRISSLYYYTL